MQPKTTKILIPILAILFMSATVDANARKIRREVIYNEIYGSAEMIDGMYIPRNVKEAVEEGSISYDRYSSYLGMLDEEGKYR